MIKKEQDSLKLFPLVGIDEAGRGCLAGPVVASAVILNFPQNFKDSKALTSQQRECFSISIKKNHKWAIGLADALEIDKLNILQASLLAMKRAVLNLKITQGQLLIDGLFKIPKLNGFSQSTFIKGDQTIPSISAASILAKTERDKLMVELNKIYPEYGFAKHKGYPVVSHKEAIKKYGPCPFHRKTFSGVIV